MVKGLFIVNFETKLARKSKANFLNQRFKILRETTKQFGVANVYKLIQRPSQMRFMIISVTNNAYLSMVMT